jgi:hypothetical protein
VSVLGWVFVGIGGILAVVALAIVTRPFSDDSDEGGPL